VLLVKQEKKEKSAKIKNKYEKVSEKEPKINIVIESNLWRLFHNVSFSMPIKSQAFINHCQQINEQARAR
jgi:hypothetical protein